MTEGDRLEIVLQIMGTVDSFTWMSSNSEVLTIGGSVVKLDSNSIEFSEVKRSDSGTYTVRATNCGGSGIFQFVVIVRCK